MIKPLIVQTQINKEFPEHHLFYTDPCTVLVATVSAKPNKAESLAYANCLAAGPELLKAAQRALPWLGKLIAEGVHMNTVCPNDAIGAMQQLEAAIIKAKG